MRFAWLVCLKDLRQRLRDRTALGVAVVVPLLLSGLVGLALGGNDAGFEMRLALVDPDRGPDAGAFRDFLAQPWLEAVVVVVPAASEEQAARLLADDEADAALVLRPGLASDASDSPDAPRAEVLASGRNAFATRMSIALAERFLANRNAAAPLPEVVPISPGGRLRTVDYYAFSMAVLFLTFTVLSGVRSMQEEVESGAIARLVASPASARSILAGKLLGLLLTGLVQMGVMIAASSLVFGTRWGSPLPVACLVLSSVFMAIGMTSFFMSVSGNAEQGQRLASISIFLLAVVGGQFMPSQGLPDVFDTLQRLTPNGQAARGFVDAAAVGTSEAFAILLEPIAVTLAVGAAGIAFAARRAGSAIGGLVR